MGVAALALAVGPLQLDRSVGCVERDLAGSDAVACGVDVDGFGEEDVEHALADGDRVDLRRRRVDLDGLLPKRCVVVALDRASLLVGDHHDVAHRVADRVLRRFESAVAVEVDILADDLVEALAEDAPGGELPIDVGLEVLPAVPDGLGPAVGGDRRDSAVEGVVLVAGQLLAGAADSDRVIPSVIGDLEVALADEVAVGVPLELDAVDRAGAVAPRFVERQLTLRLDAARARRGLDQIVGGVVAIGHAVGTE